MFPSARRGLPQRMECKLLAALLFLWLFGDDQRNFVDTAPLENEGNKSADYMVTELENLKNMLGEAAKNGEEVSVSKSQTSFFLNNDGYKSGYSKLKNEVEKNGKLITKIQQKMNLIKNKNERPKAVMKTEIEIPSKGIHDAILKSGQQMKINPKNTLDGRENEIDKINNLGGLDYSSMDMAKYIYWTGDEKNVALMIEEFLEEGLMSRQEAINFLQSIKFNLDFMQARDKSLQKKDKKISNLIKKSSYENPSNLLRREEKNGQEDDNKARNLVEFDSKSLENSYQRTSSDNDESDLMTLKRPTTADFFSKKNSLEEIIYQIAKVMFSQNLTGGSSESEKSLQKLILLLQKEVKNGQISRNFERKLLDVLFAAYMDSFSTRAESASGKKENLPNNSDFFTSTSESTSGRSFMPEIESKLKMKEGLREKILSRKVESTA